MTADDRQKKPLLFLGARALTGPMMTDHHPSFLKSLLQTFLSLKLLKMKLVPCHSFRAWQ